MNARDGLMARAKRLLQELDVLADEVTVVGGTSPALYAMSAAVSMRPTSDVDLSSPSRFAGPTPGGRWRYEPINTSTRQH